MLIELKPKTKHVIQNPTFAGYVEIYEKIYADFMEQIQLSGIELDDRDLDAQRDEKLERIRQKKAIFRNNGKSIYVNAISPACEACRTGVGSATYFISLKCHRDCYYCFNPNQENFNQFSHQTRNAVSELEQVASQNQKVKHIALTGGEPLLHKIETVAFFQKSKTLFPKAYTRLYTTGDQLNDSLLAQLKIAGLDEIRFSIRMHDLARGHRTTFERIEQARNFVPRVMVEMPVLPGTYETMQDVLLELDRLGVYSINLLEFCYPFHNAAEFNRLGFKIKQRPFRVLYNYWYAGGLPISESELVCLDLMEFAMDRNLKLGVHYCSLENKHTGQIYQQNKGQKLPVTATISNKDYFVKSAKVFGTDIPIALRAFKQYKMTDYYHDLEYDYLEFHVNEVKSLARFDLEVGISSAVVEYRDGEQVIRELKVDYTTSKKFERYKDM